MQSAPRSPQQVLLEELRVWMICALLAIPSIFWPLLEWVRPWSDFSLFLPFVNQIDVALPLGWMVSMGREGVIGDPSLWEYRHAAGSPFVLCSLWPSLMAAWIKYWGSPAAYWCLVYLLHLLWLRAALFLVKSWLGREMISWLVAVGFVYFSFWMGINVYFHKFRIWDWSIIPFYESFRAFPSVIVLTVTTTALCFVRQAWLQGSVWRHILAGIAISLAVYGRPFDWMILVTFCGLLILRSAWRREFVECRLWMLSTFFAILGASWFIWEYIKWNQVSGTIYTEQLERGVMEGKEPIHFLKYAALALICCAIAWIWLGLIRRVADPDKKIFTRQGAFLRTLILASFLPYFQFLPSGRTITGYQYFFEYFSIPMIWLTVLLGIGALIIHGSWWRVRLPGTVLSALLLALFAQSSLAFTPGWMVDRVAFDRRDEIFYGALRESKDPVVLSLGGGASQQLMLRGHAWSFVPHPMMYTFGSLASTAELVERQLLAKLLMTGTVEDLAPLFSEEGLPDYFKFYEQAPESLKMWLDRLENCPARQFFVFHPTKSRKDFALRSLQIPKSRLEQGEPFAYFSEPYRKVFQSIRELQTKSMDDLVAWVLDRHRLTHLLLFQAPLEVASRIEASGLFEPVASNEKGVLLQVKAPGSTPSAKVE